MHDIHETVDQPQSFVNQNSGEESGQTSLEFSPRFILRQRSKWIYFLIIQFTQANWP